MINKFFFEWSALYVVSMNPSLYTVQGRQGMEEVILGKDDSDNTLATYEYMNYFSRTILY